MNLFLDNTGIHAVGRCLNGTVRGESGGELDLAGFLQFVTQLIFAETLHFSTFEAPGVAARSRDVASTLQSLGVPADVLRPFSPTADVHSTASLAAAGRLAADLAFVLPGGNLTGPDLLTSVRPDLNAVETEHEGRFHRALISGLNEHERAALRDEALTPEFIGSAAYMLTASDSLWAAAARLRSEAPLSRGRSEQLMIHIRYYLNEEMARNVSIADSTAEYAPAVPRARIVKRCGMFIIAELNKAVGSAAAEFEPISCALPSIAFALMSRSKGDRRALVEEALQARQKATDLRRYFAKLARQRRNAAPDANDSFADRRAVGELSFSLRQSLGLEKQPALSDVFEIQFLGLVPLPNFAKAWEWFDNQRKQNRVAILSEFAKSIVDSNREPFAYRKLHTAVTSGISIVSA